jgi:hypothetical protein
LYHTPGDQPLHRYEASYFLKTHFVTKRLQRIMEFTDYMSENESIGKAINSLWRRAELCINKGGGHFEHNQCNISENLTFSDIM